MDLKTYLKIFRRRWMTIAITLLVTVLLVAGYTVTAAKKYSSEVQFFVSTANSTNVADLAQGSAFSQAAVSSYAQLVTSPVVLQPVIKQLHLSQTPRQLADQITVTVPADTALIDVAVTESSPREAERVASAIGSRFPSTMEGLEKVPGKSASPVRVTLTQPATTDGARVSPKPIRNLALAVAVGLLLGLALAVLRHALDSKVRTKEDVEGLSDGLTVLGGIPFDDEALTHPLLVSDDTHSPRAEAFRTLRTNLRFVDVAHHPSSIVVTSALSGEGKTTTTANLGLSLAEAGSSVCLVEGDLRRPKLLEYLGLEGAVGLTDVLVGAAELADVLQPFGTHQLALLGAGSLPPNPSELLGSAAMADIVRDLQGRFDYVLIDAPPVVPVTDAAVLTSVCDGTVLIVGSGLVNRDQARTALESLLAVEGNLFGAVLNRVPRPSWAGGDDHYSYEYRPVEGRPTAKPTTHPTPAGVRTRSFIGSHRQGLGRRAD